MNRQSKVGVSLMLAALAGLIGFAGLSAKDAEPKKEQAKPEAVSSIKAKPLSANVKKGLEYLVNQQNANGGWGQGGGWRNSLDGGGRIEGANVADPPDVASTCMAVLALLRAGNTPKDGPYAKNVAKALEFICSEVEKSDKDSMYVTAIRGTQVQGKIGPYVDTFLATLVLAELKGNAPDDNSEKRLAGALNKVVAKIEKNQKDDGTFAGNHGWASVLSQGLCSKGLNRAFQNGVAVKTETLKRDNDQSVVGLDKESGKFASPAATGTIGGLAEPRIDRDRVVPVVPKEPIKDVKPATPKEPIKEGKLVAPAPAATAPSDAGVTIYNTSARAAGLQETDNSLARNEERNRRIVADPKAPKDAKEKAQRELAFFEEAKVAQQAAVKGLVSQVDDKGFIQGFGSNGGEEFLSYMNIAETLVVKGGDEWAKWDKAVTDNLNRVQDKDGGWSGHHCITGRTFCTAAALLTLMADRAPVPVAAAAPEKK
jgi:hypothetical protein